jgi:hypothetical protein
MALLPERYAGRIAAVVSCVVRTAMHAVNVDQVASFLGRQLTGAHADELGNDFHTHVEHARLKHHMGSVAIKLYDTQALVLRVKTTRPWRDCCQARPDSPQLLHGLRSISPLKDWWEYTANACVRQRRSRGRGMREHYWLPWETEGAPRSGVRY